MCTVCGSWELNGVTPNSVLERMTGWRTPGAEDASTNWLAALAETVFHLGGRHMQSLMDPITAYSPVDSLSPVLKLIPTQSSSERSVL